MLAQTLERAPVASAPTESPAARLARLNCAGQGCPERDECRRYATRVASGKFVAANGYEHKTFTWASFDLERQKLGTCASLIRVRVT